ncbi:MAG: ATP-dependent helicase [Deltaproteobacteria bacterium]|nr:ATP-dependent helicase [Deltaproteobacteria bacterium]
MPCYTVHGAKGLEFDHVYLIGMAQEVFPSFQALRSSQRERALEEERRSCFVAITRAQETLTITWAQRYNGWSKGPSMFLEEMLPGRAEDEGGPPPKPPAPPPGGAAAPRPRPLPPPKKR